MYYEMNIKLCLIKRMCMDFNDKSSLNVLYYTLVQSILEYASLVWHSDSIAQYQCLMFLT